MSLKSMRAVSAVELRERLEELLPALKLGNAPLGRPLRVVGVGAGAWGSVFIAMLQEMYGEHKELVDIRLWRRGGRIVPKAVVSELLTVINGREDVLRRLRNSSVYLKYVSGRLGDRTMTADELLRDGFCLNLPESPLCPLQVVTELEEAVYDADIIINGLPSTETRNVFERIARVWNATRDKSQADPVVVSLSKGVETSLEPHPHIITPTRVIHEVTGVPLSNLMYLGGPNIASEIWRGEYANARICSSDKMLRKAMARFLRNDNFVVWASSDVITHEVLGGLKNVYAIGMGIVTAATNNSATSKAVYFSNAAAEMVFITRLLSKHPEDLHGPLLADTYVTLLKGRNAWYGERVGRGEIHPRDGDVVPGKGLIQGVSAVHAFCQLFSDSRVTVFDRVTDKTVCPLTVLTTLKSLQEFLLFEGDMAEASREFVRKLKDASATDPAQRLRTHNLHLPFLTKLPDEELSHDDDDDDLAITKSKAAASSDGSGRQSISGASGTTV